MTAQTTPEEFDLLAWLGDAKRPERVVEVFKRTDLLAELDRLAIRIANVRAVPEEERSLADSPSKLEAEHNAILEKIIESKLEVTIRGLINSEVQKLLADHKKSGDPEHEYPFKVLAQAVVSPKLDAAGWRSVNDVIGQGQFNKLMNAYATATDGVVNPSAAFLHKSSTSRNGDG